jgi:hypothetical protein
VSVLPGKEAEVAITFRPPAKAQTPTGSVPFAIRAVSEVGSSSSAVAEGRLELAGAAGLQAWADNTAASGRWSAKYHLTFANQGNAPVRLAVTAHDPASTLKFILADEVVDVPPGGQIATEVKAKTRQPFLRGSPVNRMFTASCQDFPFGAARPIPGQAPPQDDPHHRTFQLSFQQKPILSKLAILAGLLVIGLLVALVLVRFRGKDELVLGMAVPAAPPALSATSAGSSSIFLEWEAVPNATGYLILTTTETGEVTGPPLDEVDATTFAYTDDELEAAVTRCYAVRSKGPEDVGNSEDESPHACATTDAAPQLAAPANFAAQQIDAASFELSWEHPTPEEVTFTVFVNNDPVKSDIAGLFTTLDVEQRDLSFDATMTVRANRGEERSNPSNELVFTIPAATVATTTSAAPTTVPGGPGVTVPGGPGDPGATTTTTGSTTSAPTTTTPPTQAQTALQDLDETWVAMLAAVVPTPAGTGSDAQRAALAAQFGVPVERILTFSNRDTVARSDATGTPEPNITIASPDDEFFYVEQLDEAAATALCAGRTGCRPMIIEGAGNAAVGSDVLVLARLDASTLLDKLDTDLQTLRTARARQAIHALDGSRRPALGTDQILLVADGFADQQALNAFCQANQITRCEPLRIER